jgi:hypothetical protein
VPPSSHLTSYTPIKSNLYLANSLAAAVSEPALHRLLTFQVPNLMSLFLCLGRTKVSVQVQGLLYECFVRRYVLRWGLVSLLPNPQAGGLPLIGCLYCLLNIFAATLHIGDLSSIHNLRTWYAVVTGAHLSRCWLFLVHIKSHLCM